MEASIKTYNLDFMSGLLSNGKSSAVRIPRNMSLDGNVKFTANNYAARFMARQGNGRLKGTVALDTRRMAYNAQLQAHQLPVQQFLPRMGLRPFTGTKIGRASCRERV